MPGREEAGARTYSTCTYMQVGTDGQLRRFGRTVSSAQTDGQMGRPAPHREMAAQMPQLDTDPISRVLFPVCLRALLCSSLHKTTYSTAWVSIDRAAADAPYQAILSCALFLHLLCLVPSHPFSAIDLEPTSEAVDAVEKHVVHAAGGTRSSL